MRYYIKRKIFSIGAKYSITDHNQNQCFTVESEIISFGYKANLYDMDGVELVKIHQQLLNLMPKYNIIKDGNVVAVVDKVFRFFKHDFEIQSDYGNFSISGDLFNLDYSIIKNGQLVATVSREMFAFTDSYCINVTDELPPEFSLAIVIIINNCFDNEKND